MTKHFNATYRYLTGLADDSYTSFDVQKDDSYTGRVRAAVCRRGDAGAGGTYVCSTSTVQQLSRSSRAEINRLI